MINEIPLLIINFTIDSLAKKLAFLKFFMNILQTTNKYCYDWSIKWIQAWTCRGFANNPYKKDAADWSFF